MSLIQSLQWRYATKRMNGQKIAQDKLNNILEATRLSASSYGLQAYTILVVENPEIRAKMQPAAWGQPQIVESSQVLVFCVPTELNEATVDEYMQNIATTRGVGLDTLAGFKSYIMGSINGQDEAGKHVWLSKQVYIALGTCLAAAAEQQVDATPMEGFVPAQIDEILGLKEKGLRSVVLCALGYRSAEDGLANAAKVRRPSNELFQFI